MQSKMRKRYWCNDALSHKENPCSFKQFPKQGSAEDAFGMKNTLDWGQ